MHCLPCWARLLLVAVLVTWLLLVGSHLWSHAHLPGYEGKLIAFAIWTEGTAAIAASVLVAQLRRKH